MLIEVKLHGDLTDFGERWQFSVRTPIEAAQAIEANSPGFIAKLQQGKYSVIAVPAGGDVTDESQVEVMDTERCGLPISGDVELHFVPVPDGEIETTIFVLTTILVDIGIPTGIALATATIIVGAAVSFALTGLANLLMPAPPGLEEDAPSYYFSGPVNSARQGLPVPLLYGGPLLVGSQVIGQSVVAEDLSGSSQLRSTAYMEIIDAISEGEIEGFANADLESSIFLDGTAFKIDGKDTFSGFEVDYTVGTQDQDFKTLNISGQPGTSSVNNVGLLLRNATGGLIRSTQDPNVGRIGITVNVPRLVYTHSDGDEAVMSVSVRVSIKGGGQPDYQVINFGGREGIAGIVKSGYHRTLTFDLIPLYGTAPFTIKVERVNADNANQQIANDVYWTSWTEMILSNLSYPNTAYAVSKFDAQQFSSVPTRGFLMKGRLVQIPSNYNPVTRAYDGAWDGLFKAQEEWTNNPAWIYRDLVLNTRYGLGRFMTEDLINKWALYAIAVYCDGLVDDGFGGPQEPRFVCNVYMQTAGEAFNVLKQLASSFRSLLFWSGGQATLNQDSPADVSYQYSASNVIGGKFSYSGTPKHTRYTVALITWNNPEDNFNAWVEYVEDEEGIQLYGVKELSFTAVGCTSRGQANRAGKYALLTSKMETDAVSWRVGLDGMGRVPGQVVKIIDPLRNPADESVAGRISSAPTLASLVLDRPVTLEGGTTYSITVTMPDATQSVHAVSNGVGTVTPPTAINFAPPLAEAPVDGAIWSLTDDAKTSCLYRIMSVTEGAEGGDSFYDISGVMHVPDKLTQADAPGGLEPPDVPPIDDGVAPPAGLTVTEGVLPINAGSGLRRYFDIAWSAPVSGFVSHYEVEITNPNNVSQTYAIYETEYRYFFEIVPGDYIISVRAINLGGQRSTAISNLTSVTALAPIDTLYITGLELIGQGNDTDFVGRSPEFVWRLTSALSGDLGDETFGGDTGIPDPWFRDYEIQVFDSDGVLLRTDTTTDRNYVYFYDRNLEDGGPRRSVSISVAVRDIYNRTSDATFIDVTNPVPELHQDIVLNYGIELITVKFTIPSDADFLSTRVYISQTPTFTKDASTLAYEGSDQIVMIGNLTGTDYYVSLESVDAFGPAGAFTTEGHVEILSTARILDELTDSISESELTESLSTKINRGNTWHSGSGAPTPTVPADALLNDYYLNEDNGDWYQLISVDPNEWDYKGTLEGTEGPEGPAGTQWYSGAGAPDDGLGEDGDFYLDENTDNWYQKVAGTWGAPSGNLTGTDGDDGEDGFTWNYVFKRAATKPATPSGDGVPTGWFDYPPPADGDLVLWTSVAKQNSLDETLPTTNDWSEPVQLEGDAGDVGPQGATWLSGAGAPNDIDGENGDFYLDESNGDWYEKVAGTWGAPSGNLAGTDGDNGDDGFTWNYIFIRSDGAPTPPSGDGVPTNWFNYPPIADGNPLWTSVAKQNSLNETQPTEDDWSTPIQLEGDAGEIGPQGATWLSGEGAPDDGDGVEGDFYLDELNGEWYQKGATTWGTPQGTLAGPTGDAGDDGFTWNYVFKQTDYKTVPDTPTGNGVPIGWTDTPPDDPVNADGTGLFRLWTSLAKQDSDGVTQIPPGWSVPQLLSSDPPYSNSYLNAAESVLEQSHWLQGGDTGLLAVGQEFSDVGDPNSNPPVGAELWDFYEDTGTSQWYQMTSQDVWTTLLADPIYSGFHTVEARSNEVTAPANLTAGHYLVIPAEYSLIFSGHNIVISMAVRQTDVDPSDEFQIKYTSLEHGASGWMSFVPTSSWQTFEFEYAVEIRRYGNVDALQIWPDTSGLGKGILMDDVRVSLKPAVRWLSGSGAPSDLIGYIGDFYLNEDNGEWYEKGATTWGTPQGTLAGPTGGTGDDGFTWNYIFLRAATQPDTPTGDGVPSTPVQWYDVPPQPDGNLLWTSVAKQNSLNETQPTEDDWSTPIQLEGDEGIEGPEGPQGPVGSTWYSADGPPDNGTGVQGDFYLDESNGDWYEKGLTTWGAPRGNLTGPTGDDGPDGADGLVWNYIFIRSAAQPSTPPAGTGVPTDWFDVPPVEDTLPLWTSVALMDSDDVVQGVWSPPVQLSGTAGASNLFVNSSETPLQQSQWKTVAGETGLRAHPYEHRAAVDPDDLTPDPDDTTLWDLFTNTVSSEWWQLTSESPITWDSRTSYEGAGDPIYSGRTVTELRSVKTSSYSTGAGESHYIEIPQEIALLLAGRQVIVSMYIKQTEVAPSSECKIAYSTADVGNSGWEIFTPTSSFQRCEFEYQVASPSLGQSDYILIWPDTSGNELGILVDDVRVEVRTGGVWLSGNGEPADTLGFIGDFYVDEDDGQIYEKTAITTWTPGGNLQGPQGDTGDHGHIKNYVFRRYAGIPPTPVGNPPPDWFDYPPTTPDLPLWTSVATLDAAGGIIIDWSVPIQLDGNDGYTWNYIFIRAATKPDTPTGDDIPDTPDQWYDNPPAADGNPLWTSVAKQNSDGETQSPGWSEPVRLEGEDGEDASMFDPHPIANFQFQTDGDEEGWTGGFSTFTVADGVGTWTAQDDQGSSDQQLRILGHQFDADHTQYKNVRMRVRWVGGPMGSWQGACWFLNETEPNPTAGYSVSIPDPEMILDEWVELDWDFTDNVNYNETVWGLRMDLQVGYDTVFEVDWITMYRKAPAASYEGMAEIKELQELGHAEITLKVDINGHVAGMGVAVSGGVSGPVTSEILMLADQFAVGLPNTEWAPSFPLALGQYVKPTEAYGPTGFIYKVIEAGTTGTPDEPAVWPTVLGGTVYSNDVKFEAVDFGETLPFIIGTVNGLPSVVMNYVYIADGVIDKVHIADATITTAQVDYMGVEVLAAGTIDVSGEILLGNSKFELSSDLVRLTIRDANDYSRVELGALDGGAYGIIIRDDSNNVILSSGGTYNSIIDNGQQDWGDITGTGIPDDGATVGAVWDTGSGGNVSGQPADADVLNDQQLWEEVQDIPYEFIFNADDASTLGFNPSFEAWSGTYPDGWLLWSNNFVTKETVNVLSGSNALHFVVPAGVAGGGIRRTGQIRLTDPMPEGSFIAGSFSYYINSVTATAGTTIMFRMFHQEGIGQDQGEGGDFGPGDYEDRKVLLGSLEIEEWITQNFAVRFTNPDHRLYGLDVYIMGEFGLDSEIDFLIDNVRWTFMTSDWRDIVGVSKPADNADVTLDNTAGSGVNIVHPRYSIFEEGVMPPISVGNANGTLDTGGFFGGDCMKHNPSAANAYVVFGTSTIDYNFTIEPGKKYIISGWVKCETASQPFQFYLRTGATGQYYQYSDDTNATPDTWERFSTAFTLLGGDTSTRALIRVDNDSVSHNMWFDGIMLEEQVGELDTPSAYARPGQSLEGYRWGSDITYENTAGSGVNMLHPRYSLFEEGVLPPIQDGTGRGTTTLDIDAGFFGGDCLKLAATELDYAIQLYAIGNRYNTPVSPNKIWIASWWAKCDAASQSHVMYIISESGGTHYRPNNVNFITSPTPDTWVRYSGLIDLTANDSVSLSIRLDNDSTDDIVWFDGLMLEEQVGALETPSVYARPGQSLEGYKWGADVTADSPQDPDWLTEAIIWSGNQIDVGNISTFIAGAAIGTAYIANAAIKSALIDDAQILSAHIDDAQIKTAHIDDLQVDTLQVAGEAITVSDAKFTAGPVGLSFKTEMGFHQIVVDVGASGVNTSQLFCQLNCTIHGKYQDGVVQAIIKVGGVEVSRAGAYVQQYEYNTITITWVEDTAGDSGNVTIWAGFFSEAGAGQIEAGNVSLFVTGAKK